MTNWFLRAKHWQLFILIFAVPIVIEMVAFVTVFATHEIAMVFVFMFVIMALVMGVQFGWFYNVGTALGKKLPENAGMNLKRFRSFVITPVIYFCFIFISMIVFGTFLFSGGRPSPFFGLGFLIIVPLHLFSMFCIFYTYWFIAKSLKMVEKWNHVEFGDYIGEFFLLWFFPVGVWFIQPRINRLFDPTLPPQVPPSYSNPFQQPNLSGQFPDQYPGQNSGNGPIYPPK
ncbi:MAG TPA: hypothetical protein VL651_07310 [Bacteroidia bacterium]|jgi:hypothetical protein|nr:hypothetical protein [Bacteroidia bacterium]